MKLREALIYARGRLASVTDEASAEAKLLLSHVTGASPSGMLLSERPLSEAELSALEAALERRLSREPLQYIIGSWGFMGLSFSVGPCALIPRQDTETLCEEALRLIGERGYKTLLDICTGTGCVAVSLAKLSGICAEASDISPECTALARENAERNGVFITVREADLFDGAGRYDIITANPPYISDADMLLLPEEVRREPELALRGGADGLDLYRRIAEGAEAHMNPGGVLLLEVGAGEAGAVSELFAGRKTRVVKDLNGVERVVIIEY